MRITVVLSAVIVAFGISSALAADMGPAKTETTSLGTVLADQKGMTLYVFDKDAQGKSNCNGQCATNWRPFAASADAKASGDWSTIKRDDGNMQWAYKGRPVYAWNKDQKIGDTTGEGLANGAWHAAKP